VTVPQKKKKTKKTKPVCGFRGCFFCGLGVGGVGAELTVAGQRSGKVDKLEPIQGGTRFGREHAKGSWKLLKVGEPTLRA